MDGAKDHVIAGIFAHNLDVETKQGYVKQLVNDYQTEHKGGQHVFQN